MNRFWAKTTSDGHPGISVYEHMLNVGCVAQCIAAISPKLLERFKLQASLVGALAALHDLGKISPGFQRKCQNWLEANGLVEIDRNSWQHIALESSHAKVTHEAVQGLLPQELLAAPKTGRMIAALLGAHHGRLQDTPSRPLRLDGATERRSGIDWEQERTAAGARVIEHFQVKGAALELDTNAPSLWWLAGLTTVADWIGSDERHFSPEGGLDDTLRSAHAQEAIETIGFGVPVIRPGLGFAELFGFPEGAQPNDMQVRARDLIQGPGVYVIEAPMGMGKTEAALWVGYELLAAGKARGVYFALPTQATSNRIHLRMSEFVNRIAPGSGKSRLIHGNSWLMPDAVTLVPASSEGRRGEDARVGADWFASAKRALLAPFGVGTVDQALLGVVAAKHFFVRHFALAGKVVILDEVHSYDLYTGTLIDRLVEVLKGLGCTVIILSATLTSKRRGQMVPLPSDAETDPVERPYPMISGDPEGLDPTLAAAQAPAQKRVRVIFQDADAALEKAVELAAQGGVVLWICNTVGGSQAQFDKIRLLAEGRFKVGLLHSRFPFWRREALEEEWMTRLGKTGETRCGCILVSTQIVEQSVDLDADLLVTDLAPTDMLLQRMGRLWRHDRPARTGVPEMVILEEAETLDGFRQLNPKAIVKALGSKAFVYSPYVLLRTLEVWKAAAEVSIPGEIRARIEATYEERGIGDLPESWGALDTESWGKLFDEKYGSDLSKKFLATRNTNLWQPALEDVEGVQTRLNELPTVAQVLCQRMDVAEVEFLDGSVDRLAKNEFRLSVAQKVHKNLVRIPRHLFDSVKGHAVFESYLHGEFVVGLVDGERIHVDGLRKGVQLRWSLEHGVSIEKDSARSEE